VSFSLATLIQISPGVGGAVVCADASLHVQLVFGLAPDGKEA
jgi:hypothetical protein